MTFFSEHDLALVALCLLPAVVAAFALVRLASAGARIRRLPEPAGAHVSAPAAEPVAEGEIVRV